MRLVTTVGADSTLLFAVLELFAGFAEFALDFRFVVQILVLAAVAVRARGRGQLELRASRTKLTIVLGGGGERLDFTLRAVGARACLGVQSVLSFRASLATTLGGLRLALMLAQRARHTFVIR